MDAAKLREILRLEFGITNDEDFYKAVGKEKGINIGIMTMPFSERSCLSDKDYESNVMA